MRFNWALFAISAMALNPIPLNAEGIGLAALHNSDASSSETGNAVPAPPILNTRLGMTWASTAPPHHHGVHWEGPHPNAQAPGDMAYAGGPVMPTANVAAIFWGQTWNYPYMATVQTSIDRWYVGVNHSAFAKTTDEYLSGSTGGDSSTINYAGHAVDFSPAKTDDPRHVLGLVCDAIQSGKVPADPTGNGYYPVYSDQTRLYTWYCAWHAAGLCSYNGQPIRVQYSFFYYQPSSETGCHPASTSTSYEAAPMAALADLSGEQLSNTRTDPVGNSWRDSAGDEAAQKCRFVLSFDVPFVQFSDGSWWKEHGTWSNEAYAAGTGHPNNLGEDGCLWGN